MIDFLVEIIVSVIIILLGALLLDFIFPNAFAQELPFNDSDVEISGILFLVTLSVIILLIFYGDKIRSMIKK